MDKCFLAFRCFQTNAKCCSHKLFLFSLLGLISALCVEAIGILLPAAIAQPSSGATTPITQNLVGEWQEQKVSIYSSPLQQTLVFAPEKKAYLFIEHSTGTNAMQFEYGIDSTAQPMQLNLLAADETVMTIFDFTSDGQLRLEFSGLLAGDPRPSAFTAKADLLQKVSNATSLVPDPQAVFRQIKEIQTPESEGILYMNLINRTQQAYYLEHGKFAATTNQLGLKIELETKNYRYQIVSQGNEAKNVKIFGRAKRSGLRSLVGTVFKIQWEDRYDAVLGIVCQTYQPSLFAPPPPFLIGNTDTYAPRCASGSQPVSLLKHS